MGRMLNQLGLPPSQRWQDKWQSKLAASRGARASAGGRGRIWLGLEFHADVEFWRLIVACGFSPLRVPRKRLCIAFTSSVHRLHFGRTLVGMHPAGNVSSPVYGGGSILTSTFELA